MAWRYTLAELARIVGAPLPEGEGGGEGYQVETCGRAGGAVGRPATTTGFARVCTDTRQLRVGDLFVALRGPSFDGDAFVPEAFQRGAAGALCREFHAEGPCLVVADPLRALQTFAAHHRAKHDIPVLAITGSCGKTTAKDLTAAVLASRYVVAKTEGNLNNDIGCPLSLLGMDETTEFAVMELGANHPGEIAALCSLVRPTESAITVVTPAHLEGFGSLDAVARAKGEIVEALPPDGCFYVNTDDPWCVRLAVAYGGDQVRFGASGDVALRACDFDASGDMLLTIDPIGRLRLPLAVRAHAVHVLIAVAVGLRHGIDEFEGPLREACAKLAHFRILRLGPLEILDDSYNANPASMAAALEALADRPGPGARFAALGSMLELGDAARELHREVGRRAGAAGVAALFAYGPNAEEMAEAAGAAGVAEATVLADHRVIAEAVAARAQFGDRLLVKGSRGMRMEKVIEALRTVYATRYADAWL
ncbi:MAG TPA: UDP-N-acetylmuramoyl-tripeptide--D-alanyl-D-alanine ligase [Candidatus Hydrogenedentes bacterium]|nr:UDP-N-acetylmuramoyl-tripeptide--D-alanyl-D-alanine ligase [Candidatus Hydrogenedentota bacterium]